jgi:hypothetical protein
MPRFDGDFLTGQPFDSPGLVPRCAFNRARSTCPSWRCLYPIASAANADGNAASSCVPAPASGAAAHSGTLAMRRKRQRQQQLVLGEHRHVDGRGRRFVLVPRRREASSRSSRARSTVVRCATGPRKRPETPLANQRHRSVEAVSSAGGPLSATRHRRCATRLRRYRSPVPAHRSRAAASPHPSCPRGSHPGARHRRSKVPPRRRVDCCRSAIFASTPLARHADPGPACLMRPPRHAQTRRPKTLDNSAIADSCQKCLQNQSTPAGRRAAPARRLARVDVTLSADAARGSGSTSSRWREPRKAPLPGEAPAATAFRLAEARRGASRRRIRMHSSSSGRTRSPTARDARRQARHL